MAIPDEWYLGQTSTSTCSDVGGPVTLESIARLKEQLESPVGATDDFDVWCWRHPGAVILCHPNRKDDLERVQSLYPSMNGVEIISNPCIDDSKVFLADLSALSIEPPALDTFAPSMDMRVQNPRAVRLVYPESHFRYRHGASKNQAGIWWSYSRRKRRIIKYLQNRRPIRGPQYRSEPYRRSCISNFSEYRSVL